MSRVLNVLMRLEEDGDCSRKSEESNQLIESRTSSQAAT